MLFHRRAMKPQTKHFRTLSLPSGPRPFASKIFCSTSRMPCQLQVVGIARYSCENNVTSKPQSSEDVQRRLSEHQFPRACQIHAPLPCAQTEKPVENGGARHPVGAFSKPVLIQASFINYVQVKHSLGSLDQVQAVPSSTYPHHPYSCIHGTLLQIFTAGTCQRNLRSM